jgi:O-antigen/teichoic acid export membrane protein
MFRSCDKSAGRTRAPKPPKMASTKTGSLREQTGRRLPWIDPATIAQAREYSSTFLTEFAIMASQILVYKLAARDFGKEGFSEYAVARRTVSLLYPVALMGLGVALPRFLGYASGRDVARLPNYYGATLHCVCTITAVLAFSVNLFSARFAYLFFGNRSYSYLTFPMSVLLVALVLHATIYSYFRGHLKMRQANTLQLTNLAIVPLLAFGLFGSSVRTVLLAAGSMTLCGVSVGFAFTPMREVLNASFAEIKVLLRYGVQRLVGDFALTALMTLPVTILVHLRGVEETGFVSFGITVLSLIGSAFAPIGLILLPKASRMFAEGARADLRAHVIRIVRATILVALSMNFILAVFAGRLIEIYLGPGFPEVTSYVRLFAFGALPYALYCVLRGVVDAFYLRAVNAINALIALGVFLLWTLVLWTVRGTPYVPIGLLVAVFVLGALTVFEAYKILSRSLPPGTVEVSVSEIPLAS